MFQYIENGSLIIAVICIFVLGFILWVINKMGEI